MTEGARAKAGRDDDEAGEAHPLERTQLQWPQLTGAAYDSRLMRVELRCASREYRVRSLVDTRGGIHVDQAEAEGDFSAIPPGSIMEGLRDTVCS